MWWKLISTSFFFFFFKAISFFFFFKLFIYLFIYLWLCWVFVSVRGLSPFAASGGHSSSRCAGLSLSRPLLLRSTGSRRAGSAIVAHGPSCSAARGIFPDQGSNPCPLHWQADPQPLRHQGSPISTSWLRGSGYTIKEVQVIRAGRHLWGHAIQWFSFINSEMENRKHEVSCSLKHNPLYLKRHIREKWPLPL